MAAETVFVGCKSPTGFVLNLDTFEVINKEQGLVRHIPGPKTVTLKGNAFPEGKIPRLKDGAFIANEQDIDGYVFTLVPKDFWDEWIKRNAESSLVVDRLVIAAPTHDAANKRAREHEKERGHNPRLIEKDPRTRSLGVKTYDPKDEGAEAA